MNQQPLLEPFAITEVKWKAQVVRGHRALCVAYVDARVVEDRLDLVFGVDGWQDSYHLLPNGNVVCKLRVKFGNEWIEKSDVGGQSDQPDEGDRMKSAFSDALKRAAVKLGIGRYLYRLPQQWVDYDPNTRQLAQTPTLPDWAHPTQSAVERPATNTAKKEKAEKMITREQWEQLKKNLTEHHAVLRRFLEHYQIEKPRDLPAKKFEEAVKLSENPPKEWLAEQPKSAA
jgi:hypothetical protein